MPADADDAEATAGGGPVHREAVVEGCGQPALQRVRTEVPLDHEPPIRPLVQARDPPLQESVQFGLPDPDGRIGADRAEGDVIGNIAGGHGVDVGEPEFVSVAAHEIQRPLVHIDGPDRGVR